MAYLDVFQLDTPKYWKDKINLDTYARFIIQNQKIINSLVIYESDN